MAQTNSFYAFLLMCTGMAAGSTVVNRVSFIIVIILWVMITHFFFEIGLEA